MKKIGFYTLLAASAFLFFVPVGSSAAGIVGCLEDFGEPADNPFSLSLTPGGATTYTISVWHVTKDFTGTVHKTWISRRGVHTVAGPSSSQSSWTWSSTWWEQQVHSFASSDFIIQIVEELNPSVNDLLMEGELIVPECIPTLGFTGMLILIGVLGFLAILLLRKKLVPKKA